MNIQPYFGQFIKIYLNDKDWMIGKIEQNDGIEGADAEEIFFTAVMSSNERINGRKRLNLRKIKRIEELDEQIQKGISMVLNYKPNIREAYWKTRNKKLPSKIEFGRIELVFF